MAREKVKVTATVGDLPVEIEVVEFPIIEDLVRAMVVESMFTRRQVQTLSTSSPVGRDIKDFIIKSNVVGD